MANYLRRADHLRRATLFCLTVMLALIAIDTLIAPSHARAPNPVVWLALSLPLAIFLPGVRRGGIQSFAWLAFVSLLYFAQGVTALFAPWRRLLDVFYLVVAIALFICAMFFVRYSARAKRASAS